VIFKETEDYGGERTNKLITVPKRRIGLSSEDK
jgi:hypothetical protein